MRIFTFLICFFSFVTILEASVDGIYFEEIGTVKGVGNSSTEQSYSFRHLNPAEGINYYRLSQTDFDGSSETFNLISIDFSMEGDLILYPNPTRGAIILESDQIRSVEIYNYLGALESQISVENLGANTLQVDISSLKKGYYFLKFGAEYYRVIKK